ncbi:MAG: flavodoxin domain-containing protein, partial [Candidatus Omnitrophica bacterium]|nr:flavodoxin domain-containing protein [Candidatus Omnitrophota bacterium]
MDQIIKDLLKKHESDMDGLLKEASASLNKEQLAWVSGYCAGMTEAKRQVAACVNSQGVAQGSSHALAISVAGEGLTVLFASHSGNGKGVAKNVFATVQKRGLKASVHSMGTYKLKDLKHEKNVLFIISTHGEGVPPGSAEELFDFLSSNRAPRLDGLKYSVLALGDKSYVNFCKAGITLDRKLEKLGAKRVFDRVDCDVDFASDAERWMLGALAAFGDLPKDSGSASLPGSVIPSGGLSGGNDYSAKNPFQAMVLAKVKLNGRGSDKETYHIELSLEGSGIRYFPGDSCGLVARNSAGFVGDVLSKLRLPGTQDVVVPAGQLSLAKALEGYELTVLTTDVLKKHNAFAASSALQVVIDDVTKLKEYLYGRDFIDLVREYPVTYTSQDLLSVLRPLPARLYSIASGPSAYDEELHLLVGALRYNAFGRNKEGVASTFWADRIVEEETVPIYIKHNEGFRLPQDGKASIIMIGPGTGVAPFRSFVEERAALGHTGKSWLFFGHQHFITDFLYQTEWQRHLEEGSLTRMNAAFSRDQHEKLYVQHKLIENGDDVYRWIEEGAFIYVCGDMKRMAPDVQDAFVKIAEKQGALAPDQAVEYVKR